jgi:hypothetical protein
MTHNPPATALETVTSRPSDRRQVKKAGRVYRTAGARQRAKGISPALTQDVTQQHPEWFSEQAIPYKPCPASVVFPDERHACLVTNWVQNRN